MNDVFNQPEVHILMPTHMAANYVGRTLQSVFEQDYPAVKLVAYDDGSTDATPKILDEAALNYPDKVKVVASPINQGIAFARAKLVSLSQEINPDAYFMWLDSDDRFCGPQSVSMIMDQFQKRMRMSVFITSISIGKMIAANYA